MKRPQTVLGDAAEIMAKLKITNDEFIRFDFDKYSTPTVQLSTTGLIRVYHFTMAPRSAVRAEESEGYLHVNFETKGFRFCACMPIEKAATFLDSKQQALPSPRAKRVNGTGQKKLAFAGDVDS